MKSLPFTRSPLSVALAPWRFMPSLIISGLALFAAPQAGAVMMDLGNLPGATGSVQAQGISADGKVVVGQISNGSTYSPFRWSADKGLSSLGTPVNESFYASAASADGRYIVVSPTNEDEVLKQRAYRWDAKNGFVDLGDSLEPGNDNHAYGISDDGSVVVGKSFGYGIQYHAFRWTEAGGLQQLAGLDPDYDSAAYGVSGDGKVTVGTMFVLSAKGHHAFRWDAGTQKVTDLGVLTGYTESAANAANRNGSVIVGSSTTATTSQAFRWSTTKGLEGLGTLGGSASSAADVDGTGAVVVGSSTQADNATRAFRWTAATGMTNLGVLSGATDSAATGISDDGRTVVGTSGARAFIWTDPLAIPAEAGLPDPGLPFGVLQDLVYLQTSLIRSADTVNHLMASQSRRLRDLTQQQCQPGANQTYCLGLDSQAYRGEASSSGTQKNLSFAAGLRINEQYSVGATATAGRADLDVQSATQRNAFALGLWGAYQQNPDNTGWGANASVAGGDSANSFERGVGLDDVQRARAKLDMNSTAMRVAGNFGVQVTTPLGRSLITPEVALNHVTTEQDGFTERNVALPLSVEGATGQESYATLGVRSATQVSAKGTLHVNVAVDTLLSDTTPGVEGHSQVPGLSSFKLDSSLEKSRVVPVATVGYSHAIDAHSTLGGGVQVAGSTYQGEQAVFGVGVQYKYAF